MDTLILSFGRMNPPTIGHAKLWNKLESLAREYNGDALLCLSKSQDKKKNPLDFNTKSRIIQQYVDEMGVNILVEDESTFADKAANIYMILPQIYREGQYKNIIFVCGSDRLEDFQSLKSYNGKPAKNEKLYYEFDSIEIESSGERDADSDDAASKASASLVRSLATEGDFDTFLQFMPDGGSNEGLAREVYDSIREAMGVEKLTEATRMNKHQSHLEDIIVDGEEGFRELLDKIDSMKAILSGSSDTEAESLSITTKIDGSPALLIWSNIDGVDGPGISLKGIIESKSPEAAQKVILTSEDQINAKYGDRPDMANKLRIVLRALLDGSLKVPDGKVVQGDLLFDSNTVDHIVEDGVEYTAFQPNTILYAVPSDSELASKINSSQVGVAFHTVYSGGIGNFSQSFKLKVATFFESIPEDFFIIDCNVPDFSGWVSFTADETEELNSNISQLHNYYQELTSTHDTEYKLLCENEEFIKMYFQTFQNKVISDKQTNFFNEETFIDDLREHCIGRIENTRAKKIASLKTEKGREKANAKLDAEKQEILDILDNDLEVISIIVKATNLASKIKLEFIEKLKNAKQLFGTFYKTSQGLIPGTQEGFAVSDNDGNIVKLVDRSCFSFHNRSADTVKGWQHSNDKMTERKTVQVTFEDDHRADLFIQFLKDEFNIPETKSRYLVVSGKDENGRSVFVENRLKEANLKNTEWEKKDFFYSKKVINNIIDNGSILISVGEDLEEVEVSDDIKEKLKLFLNSNKEDFTVNKFNSIVEENFKKFEWKQIYKGTFTTDMPTDLQEAIQASIIEKFWNKKYEYVNIEDFYKDVLFEVSLSGSKYRSHEELINALLTKKSLSSWSKFFISLAQNSKEKITKIIGNIIGDNSEVKCYAKNLRKNENQTLSNNLNKFFGSTLFGVKKDTLNKSDIILCFEKNPDEYVENFFTECFKSNIENFITVCKKELKNGSIIGISLKKASPDFHVSLLSSNNEDNMIIYNEKNKSENTFKDFDPDYQMDGNKSIVNIKIVEIDNKKKWEIVDNVVTCNIRLFLNNLGKNNMEKSFKKYVDVVIRRNNTSGPVTIELKHDGSSAQMGKVVGVFKSLVGDLVGDFDKKSKEIIKNLKEKNPDTIARVKINCILEKFSELYYNPEYDFNFIMSKLVSSTGYPLKNNNEVDTSIELAPCLKIS